MLIKVKMINYYTGDYMAIDNKDLSTNKIGNIPSSSPITLGNTSNSNINTIGRVIDVDPINGLLTVAANGKVYENVKLMQPVSSGSRGSAIPYVNNYRNLFEQPVNAHIVFVDGAPYCSNVLPNSYNIKEPATSEFKKAYKNKFGKEYIDYSDTTSAGSNMTIASQFASEEFQMPSRMPENDADMPNEYTDSKQLDKVRKAIRDSYYIVYSREELENMFRQAKNNPTAYTNAMLKKLYGGDGAILNKLKDLDSPFTHRSVCWPGDAVLYEGKEGSKIVGMDDGKVAMIGGTYCHSTWAADQRLTEFINKHYYYNSSGKMIWGPESDSSAWSANAPTRMLMEMWTYKNNNYDSNNSSYDPRKIFRVEFAESVVDYESKSTISKDPDPMFLAGLYEAKSSKNQYKKSFNEPFKTIAKATAPEATSYGPSKFKIKVLPDGGLEIVSEGDIKFTALNGKLIIKTKKSLEEF